MSAGVRGTVTSEFDHGRIVIVPDTFDVGTPVLVLPMDPASCAARETAVADVLCREHVAEMGEPYDIRVDGHALKGTPCDGCRRIARAVLAALGAG